MAAKVQKKKGEFKKLVVVVEGEGGKEEQYTLAPPPGTFSRDWSAKVKHFAPRVGDDGEVYLHAHSGCGYIRFETDFEPLDPVLVLAKPAAPVPAGATLDPLTREIISGAADALGDVVNPPEHATPESLRDRAQAALRQLNRVLEVHPQQAPAQARRS